MAQPIHTGRPTTSTCPHCDAVVGANWNFCKNCAMSLSVAPAPQGAGRRGAGSGMRAGTGRAWPFKATIVAVAAVVALGALALGIRRLRGARVERASNQPVSQTATTQQPTPSPTAQEAATPATPESMVYVPGGSFMMGRDDGDENERPAHLVTVDPFFIDRLEVTCGDYLKFVKATGYRPPRGWSGGRHPVGAERLPVTGVSWNDASAYARWARKRLPYEAEWEFAARGPRGLLYPWGNEWLSGAANAGPDSRGKVVEVGTFRSASPFDLLDMIGNAWEWTASPLKPYSRRATSDAGGGQRLMVLRGGCYLNSDRATATFRRGWPAEGADYGQTGFRCAMSYER